MLNLLRCLDNPRQDIPLVAVLHSELGNFTNDYFARLRYDKGIEEIETDLVPGTDANHQFKTVYVELTDSMINGSYSTTDTFSTLRALQVVYEGRITTMHYKVVF